MRKRRKRDTMKKNKTNSIIGANPRKKRKAPYIVLGALAIIAGLGCAFYGGYTLGKNAKAADNGREIVAIKDNQVAIKCAYNAKSGAKYGTYNLYAEFQSPCLKRKNHLTPEALDRKSVV